MLAKKGIKDWATFSEWSLEKDKNSEEFINALDMYLYFLQCKKWEEKVSIIIANPRRSDDKRSHKKKRSHKY